MARIRSLKLGFFSDDELAARCPSARLQFVSPTLELTGENGETVTLPGRRASDGVTLATEQSTLAHDNRTGQNVILESRHES